MRGGQKAGRTNAPSTYQHLKRHRGIQGEPTTAPSSLHTPSLSTTSSYPGGAVVSGVTYPRLSSLPLPCPVLPPPRGTTGPQTPHRLCCQPLPTSLDIHSATTKLAAALKTPSPPRRVWGRRGSPAGGHPPDTPQAPRRAAGGGMGRGKGTGTGTEPDPPLPLPARLSAAPRWPPEGEAEESRGDPTAPDPRVQPPRDLF